jgi:hypothetical protein
MKLVVHVGPHKTGTTAIQNMLAQNPLACVRSFLSRVNHGAHGAVRISLGDKEMEPETLARRPHKSAVDYLSMFLRDAVVANANVLVLSSEDFSLLTQQE